MNKHNVKVYEEDGELIAEWCDRAPDDEDRYEPDSIFLYASVPVESGEKALWTEMARIYDKWIGETRR